MLEATNGEEGLQQAQKHHPDLIICDLKMPIMNGWEMVKQLRQLKEFKHTIIIVSSASVFECDRHLSSQVGSNDFLPKPIQTR